MLFDRPSTNIVCHKSASNSLAFVRINQCSNHGRRDTKLWLSGKYTLV